MGCKASTAKIYPDQTKNDIKKNNEENDKKEVLSDDASIHVTKTVLAADYEESRHKGMKDMTDITRVNNNKTSDKQNRESNPNDKRNSINKTGRCQCIESELYKSGYDDEGREIVNQ